MTPVDQAAAQRLLGDFPPEYYPDRYERGHEPREQFEIDDTAAVPNTRQTWLKSLQAFGTNKIVRPVHYVIDPVANFWWKCSIAIEERVSRHANVLVVKRLVFVLIIACFCIYVGYSKSESYALSTDLRDHTRLKAFIHDDISADRLQETTEFLAKMPHFAGSQGDLATAMFVHDTLQSYGLKTTYDRFNTFLSHGNTSLCELRRLEDDEIIYSSNLQEGTAIASNEPSQKQPPTQMSLVFPGEAEGHLIYANYGTDLDFTSILCNATIAIVKMGTEPPGDIAMRAQKHGVAGVLFMAQKMSPDEKSWPEGRDYPYDAIPQGSNGWPQKFPGDILSPGWPSSDVMVINRDQANIAQIPVAAISWNDAAPLLNSLQDYGLKSEAPGQYAPDSISEWWTGPNPDQVVRLVVNPIAEDRHQMQNVFGHLEGREQPEKMVIIGARIDAMCYGTSQLAGLNVILEVARVLTNLRRNELWEPLRSIYFVLWDGTAHNFAGSTEWVEGVAKSLRAEGISYIDLDLGISGSKLQVQGTPLISVNELLSNIGLSHTKDRTLADILADRERHPIPGYGNHLAFESHTGVPTLKLGFVDPLSPVPVDSCYDSIEWMHKYGDPSWERHVALAELVAGLAIDIADGPLLPFNFVDLGEKMSGQVKELTDWSLRKMELINESGDYNIQEDLLQLSEAVDKLKNAAGYYEDVKRSWEHFFSVNKDEVTGSLPELLPLVAMRHSYNTLVDGAVKSLWDTNGLPKRNWYKNHYLGPHALQDHFAILPGVFPGIIDALDSNDIETLKFAFQDATTHISTLAEYLINIKS